MAVEGQQMGWSFIAGGTIVQHTFVKLSASNTVIACAGTTDKPIGVAQDAASAGDAVNVCICGITKIEGDADLAYGNAIGTSADAQAAAYSVTDTTKYIVGTVLIDNGAAAGKITAVIDCAGPRVLA